MTKEGNIERISKLKNIVESMPERPGSYQFFDKEGNIIYVGRQRT